MERKIHVTIFNEHNQDRSEPVKSVYPDGIHAAIAQAFHGYDDFDVTIATQDMPSHGLSEEVLAATDVLIWWSHIDNAAFDDTVASRICYHVVNRGMGFVALHSSIFSKPWQRMLGIYYDAGPWVNLRFF
ncbi:ThuA domain-containing protein [Cohnella zeiphila]|uniref:ThuA domain-containing protein n=1 Tax=Cohnella zeiphila TaxID=2761120 RepID=A0A7X0SVA0_9BACL|nr:ThuA domain-containing protein [Cohnella zeiphila]MBB6735555.1 ThuA domain-containing protein [Cohnella zeiphila]